MKVEDRWDDKIPEAAFAKAWREANSRIVPLMVKASQDFRSSPWSVSDRCSH